MGSLSAAHFEGESEEHGDLFRKYHEVNFLWGHNIISVLVCFHRSLTPKDADGASELPRAYVDRLALLCSGYAGTRRICVTSTVYPYFQSDAFIYAI